MNPVRPFVVRFGALGDMVILTALIRRLHARFGEPVDLLASGEWVHSLLGAQPGVGRIYTIGSRRWPYWLSGEQRRLVDALSVRGPSATWMADDFPDEKNRRLLARAGWRDEHLSDIRVYDDTTLHLAERYQLFAQSSPAALRVGGESNVASEAFGELLVTSEQRAEVSEWLVGKGWLGPPLILVQTGNKRTMRRGARDRASNTKYWPERNWAEVLRGLRNVHRDHLILLMGVPAEAQLNDDILALAGVENAFNIARDLPIRRLVALTERAMGLVSVDTGPAHVAAAVGCPVVTLFGKANPVWYAPRGRSTRVEYLTGVYEGEPSMLGIQPAAVLQAWERITSPP